MISCFVLTFEQNEIHLAKITLMMLQ